MTKKIFISYRSTERESVKEFAELIESFNDYKIWWDVELLPGVEWWDKIIENLKTADIVIVMLSRAYWESDPCELERNYARELNIPFLPVVIDSDLSTLREFATTQYHRFYGQYKDKQESHIILQKALELIELKSKPDPLPTPPPAPVSQLIEIELELKEQLPEERQYFLLSRVRLYVEGKPDELIPAIKVLDYFVEQQALTNSVRNMILFAKTTIEDKALSYITEKIQQSSKISSKQQQQFFNFLKQYRIENPSKIQTVDVILESFAKYLHVEEVIRQEVYDLIGEIIPSSEPIVDLSDSPETAPIIEEEIVEVIDSPEEGRTNNRLVYIVTIAVMVTTIIVASGIFTQIGQTNRNATATQQAAIVLAGTEAQSTQDSIDTGTADAQATETQNSIDMTANAVLTQEAISTSEAQTTADTAIAETSNAQAIIEASATQDAIDTTTADEIATQDAISTVDMQTEVAFAENEAQATQNAIATESQASVEAGETQNAIDTATAYVQATETQNSINIATADAVATNDTLATQAQATNDVAQVTTIAQETLDALATENTNSSATANAEATLTAIPTNTAIPSPTLPPYAISLENYDSDDPQTVIQELREIGIIGSQGQLLFEENNVFVRGQGRYYQELGSNTPSQNVILSAEIHLESDSSSELEFCALLVRVQENSEGVAVTNVTVALTNDGRLFVEEYLGSITTPVSQKVESVSINIDENNHLIVLAVDNLLLVYLNGEPIIQNYVIDEHDGTTGLSIAGQNSSSRCEAENLWAYEVQ